MKQFRIGDMMRTGGAAAVSQLLLLATMPIVVRLFDPVAFGVLGLFISISNILSILGHLGYSDAIIAVDEDNEASILLNAVLWISLISLLPVAMLTFLAIHMDLLGFGSLPLWAVFAVPCQVASIGLVFAMQQRSIRAQNFKILALSHLALGATRAGGQVLAGLLFATPASMVGSELVSRVSTIAALLRSPQIWSAFTFRITAKTWALLFELRHFAAMRSAAILLNTINVGLPTLIIARYFELVDVGIITFTFGVLFAPLGFVQKAVGDIFTGTYRTLISTDLVRARRTALQFTAILSVIGAVIMGVLLVAGETLFVIAFGPQWALSGQTAQIFAPLIFAMTVVMPLSTSLNILRRPGLVVAFNLLRLSGLIVTLIVVPAYDLSYLETVRVMAALLFASTAIFGVMVYVVNRAALNGSTAPTKRVF